MYSYTTTNAITKVSLKGDQIEVHCYSSDFDTVFMLHYYQHHDSIMVCLTGKVFENMYGHMLGDGHMSGGMMGDMHNDETGSMHNLRDEHQTNDEHFGGFEMITDSFSYTFRRKDGDFRFLGSKK